MQFETLFQDRLALDTTQTEIELLLAASKRFRVPAIINMVARERIG